MNPLIAPKVLLSLIALLLMDKVLTLAVRDRKLEKLRSASYDGTPQEWSSILHHVLYSSTAVSADLSEKLRSTLDVTCMISGNEKKSSLNIIIRQSVEGITHKFGALVLPYTDDTDEVDLFGWAIETVDERDSLAARLKSSNTRMEDAERTIKSLQDQLSDLVKAKVEHENQLLSKFALLLNEKKLRIRTQQQQIKDQHAHSTSRSAPRAKDARKRKAVDRDVSEDASDSEGFDPMDIEHDDNEAATESDDARTTSAESESESEPESAAKTTPAPLKPLSRNSPVLPPPRELPFGDTSKSLDGSSHTETVRKPVSDDEETASENDEL